MAQKKINIAVAGATGAVGNQMIRCLEEMNFPANSDYNYWPRVVLWDVS